jgi:hypothetical protein
MPRSQESAFEKGGEVEEQLPTNKDCAVTGTHRLEDNDDSNPLSNLVQVCLHDSDNTTKLSPSSLSRSRKCIQGGGKKYKRAVRITIAVQQGRSVAESVRRNPCRSPCTRTACQAPTFHTDSAPILICCATAIRWCLLVLLIAVATCTCPRSVGAAPVTMRMARPPSGPPSTHMRHYTEDNHGAGVLSSHLRRPKTCESTLMQLDFARFRLEAPHLCGPWHA